MSIEKNIIEIRNPDDAAPYIGRRVRLRSKARGSATWDGPGGAVGIFGGWRPSSGGGSLPWLGILWLEGGVGSIGVSSSEGPTHYMGGLEILEDEENSESGSGKKEIYTIPDVPKSAKGQSWRLIQPDGEEVGVYILDNIRIGSEGFEFEFRSEFGGRSFVRGAGWKIRSVETGNDTDNDQKTFDASVYLDQCQTGESRTFITPDGLTLIRDRRIVSVVQETHGASAHPSIHITTSPEQIVKIEEQSERVRQTPIERIGFVPYLYMGDMPDNVISEICDAVNACNFFEFSWSTPDDDDDFPQLKRWVISTYGDGVKKHKYFAIGHI